MRLYQMRDKIIYGTVRQYHIWFILTLTGFGGTFDIFLCFPYNTIIMEGCPSG